jgi:geranylgeranyl pyrophosphate synthase
MIETVLREGLREGKHSSVKQDDLLEAIVRSGALEQARNRANEYAEDARSALDALPDSEYSDSLKALPTYILDRDR